MLHSALLNLFCSEAVVLRIFLQRFKISSVCSVLCCLLSRHRSAVTINNNAVSRHNRNLVYRLSVIVPCYHVRHPLSVLVVLVVAVVDSASFLVHGETLALLVAVISVMRRSKAVCLNKLIVSLYLRAVRQCACALVAHNALTALKLLASNTYITYFTYRTYTTYFTYLLHSCLNLFLSHCLLDIGI